MNDENTDMTPPTSNRVKAKDRAGNELNIGSAPSEATEVATLTLAEVREQFERDHDMTLASFDLIAPGQYQHRRANVRLTVYHSVLSITDRDAGTRADFSTLEQALMSISHVIFPEVKATVEEDNPFAPRGNPNPIADAKYRLREAELHGTLSQIEYAKADLRKAYADKKKARKKS